MTKPDANSCPAWSLWWATVERSPAMAAEDIERPVIELDRVEWSMLVDFLECGQLYE